MTGSHVSAQIAGLRSRAVFRNKGLVQQINRVVREYAMHFESGDETAAKIALLHRMTGPDFERRDAFRLGVKTGICVTLVIWILVMVNLTSLEVPDDLQGYVRAYTPVYRCTLVLCGLMYACYDSVSQCEMCYLIIVVAGGYGVLSSSSSQSSE